MAVERTNVISRETRVKTLKWAAALLVERVGELGECLIRDNDVAMWDDAVEYTTQVAHGLLKRAEVLQTRIDADES